MSVLRQGSAFFQRRLTQLYTDTKSSCENVSSAPKPNDDPELTALHRNLRTQKDRLLAWGLDWSDSSAAQPNDIDEALTAAGFSDVVASVMSSIQKLLNEAEQLQQPHDMAMSPKAGGTAAKVMKTTWTDDEIARSKVLLDELTSHIDTLYDLSRSRRNMSLSMSNAQSLTKGQDRPPLSRSLKSKESYYSTKSTESNFSSQGADTLKRIRRKVAPEREMSDFQMAPFQNLQVDTSMPPAENPFEASLADAFPSTKEFYIDRGALQIAHAGVSHASTPPPYEPLSASANSRVVGQLASSAIPVSLGSTVQSPTVPVLVEFSPILLEMQNSLLFPRSERLSQITQTIQTLVDNTHVSHLGLLKFIGYFVDMTCSRYAFIYQIPLDIFPLLRQPSEVMKDITPRPLVSFFHTGDDNRDSPAPNLEVRFRLAYNLLLALLHIRSQNIVHGNINSNNILIFPDIQLQDGGILSKANADFRRPYLSSLSLFDGGDKNLASEPLSSSMYRHPDDHRSLGDHSSWSYDLYSLGLVLLEIGLWMPLSRLWKMKYNNAMFKSRIENVYVKKLGAKCGNSYLQLVQLCLDAPNFHISPEPMADLGMRVPQTYYYPWHDPSQRADWDTFSKNFTFTLGKISWRCANMDIFSPPPAADLDEYLPPPISLELENMPSEQVQAHETEAPFGQQTVPVDIPDDAVDSKLDREKGGMGEKRVRKRTLKKWNMEIPDEHLRQWNSTIMPKLSKLLQKILKDSPESCTATLMVAGETAETAKSTICVTCTNIKRVRAALKKYFEYDTQEWDLIVLKGDVRRSKVPRRRRRKPKTTKPTADSAQLNLNPHYQQRPACGASIGAFRLDEHLPPVSYGGAILVDGMPYGMTVHHMLDNPCDDDEEDDLPPRSAGDWIPDARTLDHEFSQTWCEEDLPDASYPLEISDDEDDDDQSISQSIDDSYDDYWLSDGYSTDEGDDGDMFPDDEDAISVGDVAGIDPDEEPKIVVTQPAIDDVDDGFFPIPEDKDDEHLASHSLGHVHASSGIRRWTLDGIKHEVDWALIKIDPERIDATNLTPCESNGHGSQNKAGSTNTSRNSAATLNKVARLEDLAGLQVQCCGRTSGLQKGRISRALTLVKMHGRQSFSSSFTVEGNFGVPGDSGAWVFDKSTGRVCGHVLAWSEKSRTAYIAPMKILLDDIARTLGASSVTLPGSEEAISWENNLVPAGGASVDVRAHSRPRPKTMVAEQLPIELGKLSLDIEEPARVRGLKDVSTATYRPVNPLMGRSRAMERQLA